MYGNDTTVAGIATLPVTGALIGSQVLMVVGLLLAGIALVLLVRRNAKHRP